MIQKQSSLNFQPQNEIFTTPQIVEQILKTKYYSSLVDYRYQLVFQRHFGNYIKYFPHFKCNPSPSDSLSFSNQEEMLNKYLNFQEITFRIKQAILSRVTKDSIAPLLRSRRLKANVINRSDKLNRNELIGIRDSNTMHTESSQMRDRGQQTKTYKILQQKIGGSTTSESNQTKEQSSEMLRKVTKDLSKMIKTVCTSSQKRKRINLKFARNFMLQKNPNKSKRKAFQSTISKTKLENININGYGLQSANYEEPEENYGLKKFRLSKNKNSRLALCPNLKSKSKQIPLLFRGIEQKKPPKDLSLCKKRDSEKSFLSPLTPKPVSISKSREGWDETSNKASKYSLKGRVSSHKKLVDEKKERYLQANELKNSKTISKFSARLLHK